MLDAGLHDADPARFASLLAAFSAGYDRYFTGDTAESPAGWPGRIVGKARPQPVMRIVVAVDRGAGREHVIGGVAAEYYRDARAVLVTYLYVSEEPAYRHHGHARTLLEAVREACGALGEICAVLAEAEWPEALEAGSRDAGDIAGARARLCFFARLGARLVDVDYVQPRLGAGKQPVSYLRLLWLPPAPSVRAADEAVRAAVDAFLGEFYAALAQETGAPVDHATLERQRRQLAEPGPLTLPLPRLQLDDVALCFHFIEPLDDGPASDELLAAVRAYECPVFHSMETDLLSRAYRTRRLFRTVCLTKPGPSEPPTADAGIPVEIDFPAGLVFRSENRRELRRWTLRRRLARAYLAPTFFFDARVIIWHLTLRCDTAGASDAARRWLDELDVIALLKLVDQAADGEFVRAIPDGGSSERRLGDAIRFRLHDGDGAALDVDALLRAVAAAACLRLEDAPPPPRALPPAAATVELLGWDIDSRARFAGISDRVAREAVCGIITGILDFDELDDAEARDTLTPSVPLDESLLRVHREKLVHVGKRDRAARSVQGTVGISPYLIIPYATVLCDERLLQRFEAFPLVGRKAGSVRSLSDALETVEETLRTRWVPNPFFYPTEQALYERALVEGGTAARRAKAEELLLELKTRLQLAREAQRETFEAIVAGLLGAISVLSLDSFVVDVVPWLFGLAGMAEGRFAGHVMTLWLASLAGLAIYGWKRPTPQRKERADGA